MVVYKVLPSGDVVPLAEGKGRHCVAGVHYCVSLYAIYAIAQYYIAGQLLSMRISVDLASCGGSAQDTQTPPSDCSAPAAGGSRGPGRMAVDCCPSVLIAVVATEVIIIMPCRYYYHLLFIDELVMPCNMAPIWHPRRSCLARCTTC